MVGEVCATVQHLAVLQARSALTINTCKVEIGDKGTLLRRTTARTNDARCIEGSFPGSAQKFNIVSCRTSGTRGLDYVAVYTGTVARAGTASRVHAPQEKQHKGHRRLQKRN